MSTTTIPSVGDELAPITHPPLTRTDIVRYAGASGDFVPLHHDETFVQALGLPSVFSIGMYQAALLANFAAEAFGPDRIRRVKLRFSEQVWPGDELTCEGAVTAVAPADEGTEVEVSLRCLRQTGGAAVTGSATFLL